MEFTLLWAALTGVAMAWLGTRIWDDGLPPRPLDLIVAGVLAGMAAGRLVAMASQGINPIIHPLDIVLVRGGVDTGAAVVGAITASLWGSRGRFGDLDAIAPAALLGLAGWHAGCLWRSACLGTLSDLPWAWSAPGGVATRHPVELYAALALALAAWLISISSWRLLTRSGGALALASLVRLATEPIRPSLDRGPVALYTTGMVVGIVVIAAGAVLARRPKVSPT